MQSGVIFLVIAMSLTPGLDGLSKILSIEFSPFLVCFLRYFAAGIVALCASRALGQPIHVPREGRAQQLVLTALLVGAMSFLITALSMVPLALATGGFLIAPLVSTVLSIVYLREPVTRARIIGSLISLVGAIVITKPAAGIELGTVFALAGGAMLGTYLAVSRGAVNKGGPMSSLAVQCLFGSVLLAPLAFYNGLPTISLNQFFVVLGLGVLSAITHYLTVLAFEKADASVLSPFLYFNLIAALVVGYLWFNEIPNLWSIFGLTLIAFGGIVTIMPGHLTRRVTGHFVRVPSGLFRKSDHLTI